MKWAALALLLLAGCDDGGEATVDDAARPDARLVDLDDGLGDTLVDMSDAVDSDSAPPDASPDAAADMATPIVPSITIDTPRPGHIAAVAVVRITGQIDDAVEAGWQLDGEGGPIEPGAFALDLRLPPGEHTVEISATSATGDTDRVRLPITHGARLAAGLSHALLIDGLAVVERGESGRAEPLPFDEATWVAANGNASYAIDGGGWAWRWGGGGGPSIIEGVDDVVALAAGGGHLLLLRGDGTVWSLGNDDAGQLGREGDAAAGPIAALEDIVDVAAGSAHSLALRADGVVFAWGSNADGALGNGETDRARHATPEPVGLFEPVRDVAAGRGHSLAALADGTVRAWGLGSSGQLGHGQSGLLGDSPSPVIVEALDEVVAVSAAGNVSHALRVDGTAVGWGQNGGGQLGVGDTTARTRPAAVEIPAVIAQLTSGAVHGLAVDRAGRWWGWGANHSGQLGVELPDGEQRTSTPVQMP